MNAAPIARLLAERLAAFDLARVPPPVIAAAKRLILDTAMVARAGGDADGVGAIARLVEAEGSQGRSTVWRDGTRRAPASATLVNAIAAAALDFDSLNCSVHPDIVVLPAALAVAEDRGASGAALLAAHIAGTELVCRLAAAARGPQTGWTHSAVFGIFGAAAAAGMLLGLDAARLTHAFGLCLSLAGGTQQANIEQALTKRLQPALAARNGVFAALAAEAGITAPAGAIDGRFALWTLYQPGDAAALLDGFGDRFAIRDTGLKKYPVCAASHPPMEALLRFRRDHGLVAENMAQIDATLSPLAHRLVGAPFDPGENPQVTAQFSIQYALACILLRGRLGIAELAADAVRAADIALLAARIRVAVEPAYQGDLVPARLRVRCRDGAVLEALEETMPGSVPAPLDGADFAAKLEQCRLAAHPAMSAAQLQALTGAVQRLDASPDAAGFASCVAASSPPVPRR